MVPRGPSRASQYQNPAFAKTLKNAHVLFSFLGSEVVKDSLERPKKAPKRHLNGSKTSTKRIPKMD